MCPRARKRSRARAALLARLRGSLTSQEEQRATAAASTPPPAGTTPLADWQLELIVQLETERFLKAFGNGDTSISDEYPYVHQPGHRRGTCRPVSHAGNVIDLCQPEHALLQDRGHQKTPYPVDNFKNALKFALAGQAGEQTPIYVHLESGAVCAGEDMRIKHIPSDMAISALNKNAKDEEVQRSKQQFDNEGRYWWDVSFALPLKSRAISPSTSTAVRSPPRRSKRRIYSR